ncbi:MAG: hypothetical protein K5894_05365 [Lachnospiraceae bacterium]|nr:hypothetical protein [Lachnospiraceae bacterium]
MGLQIAGAVLLIIKYWGNTLDRVINIYYPGTGIASNDGDDYAVLEAKRVVECAMEIYDNRMAFIYIADGYAFSIIGEKGVFDNIIVLIMVIVSSVFFYNYRKIVSKKIAKTLYEKDIKIPYQGLPDYIDRTASIEDIENLKRNMYKD